MDKKYKYRLRKVFRRLPTHSEWKMTDEKGKERVERNSPNRFEFVEVQTVKAQPVEEAKVKEAPKRGRKKQSKEDK